MLFEKFTTFIQRKYSFTLTCRFRNKAKCVGVCTLISFAVQVHVLWGRIFLSAAYYFDASLTRW